MADVAPAPSFASGALRALLAFGALLLAFAWITLSHWIVGTGTGHAPPARRRVRPRRGQPPVGVPGARSL
jgi:hypothetical protein